MTMLNDRAERRRIAKLEANVVALDNAILAAERDMEEDHRNAELLTQRKNAAEAAHASEMDAAADVAADLLVANPKASVGANIIARWRGAKADPEAEIAALRRAVMKAERMFSKRRDEIAELKAEREKAWKRFLTEARNALLAEFDRRVRLLLDESVFPIKALEMSGAAHGMSISAMIREVNLPRQYTSQINGTVHHDFLNVAEMPWESKEPMMSKLMDELRSERG